MNHKSINFEFGRRPEFFLACEKGKGNKIWWGNYWDLYYRIAPYLSKEKRIYYYKGHKIIISRGGMYENTYWSYKIYGFESCKKKRLNMTKSWAKRRIDNLIEDDYIKELDNPAWI